MSKFSYIGLRVAICLVATLFSSPRLGAATPERRLGEVTVTASRPMSAIGITKSTVDSAALRENIALSMADVLGFNSSLFVKSSGRATLATVAFRGTAPSHTGVTWNGLPLNSPSLGMTDFSMIPAYFIDRANLLHGSSSLTSSAGSLGGLVELSSTPADIPDGFNLQYIQGVGSFTTFDEFIHLSYGSEKWRTSTRAVLSTSRNNFPFINRDVVENIYDDDHNIVGRYYPRRRNTNGAYRDFHILQQVYFTPAPRHQLGLNVWYTAADRDISLTTLDFTPDTRRDLRNERDYILRSVISYAMSTSGFRFNAKGGFTSNIMHYDYAIDRGDGSLNTISKSRTDARTAYLRADATYAVNRTLHLGADLGSAFHHVITADEAPFAPIGYNCRRADVSAAFNARWQPVEQLGLAALIREELNGGRFSPIIPALFVDYTPLRSCNLTLRASISRNYHTPSLNDLYFIPGGNPDLDDERGWSYDAGASFDTRLGGTTVSASATWFDSRIDDWILWLPTNKGFFSPRNIRSVHSYGVELKAGAGLDPFRDAHLDINASLTRVNSLNTSANTGAADQSVGKQLPYIPRLAASATVGLTWRRWALNYKLCYYSTRYTMTSNQQSVSGSLPPYLMNDLGVERRFAWRPLDLSVKLTVNNLFDAEYQTIMAHPMPGINFELFLSVTPHF